MLSHALLAICKMQVNKVTYFSRNKRVLLAKLSTFFSVYTFLKDIVLLIKDTIAYELRKANRTKIYFRDHQQKVIEGYCGGKDVFLPAPTGS